jgi:DNA repair protein RadD
MVGTTATPFRLDIGPLCRPDALFQKVCYSANIRELIEAGYLTNLITRSAAGSADTSGLRVVRGEFATGDSAALFNSLVAASCAEIVAATRERQSVLVFCSGVNHADQVATELARLTGERCGLVTGETLPIERSATLAAFGSRQLRYLCNVDVLTTGFDAPCIDCIAILRATMSAGLYAQICGRGFRMFPGKENCLVLDFGENIKRHGPLDAIEYGRCKRTGLQPGEAPRKTCPNCEAECYAGSANCQECGLEFPSRELNHAGQADTETPILSEPEYWIVEEVYYAIHEKKKKSDGPLTMRVDYVCQPVNGEGNLSSKQISEWVCIEHEGFAWKKAAAWWKARSIAPMPATVEEAVELARCGALAAPDRITTQRDGRWYRILSARLDERPTEWAASEEEMMDEVPF